MDDQKSAELAQAAASEILTIAGVFDSGRGSYRVGKRVFIRLNATPDGLAFGFKLPPELAAQACNDHPFVVPMKFGKMGTKGWVDLKLTRRSQLAVLMRLLRKSRALYD